MEIFKPEKKVLARFGIPMYLKFSLAWTLLFAFLGIAVQLITRELTLSNFYNFFGSNYLDWFRSFGSFTNPQLYSSMEDLLIAIVSKWYYFFFTGGLISLIWAVLSWIINFELEVTKKVRDTEAEKQIRLAKESEEEEKMRKIQEQEAWAGVMRDAEKIKELEMLLMKGENFVKLKNLKEARETYLEIRAKYEPSLDKDKKLFQRILKFYNSLAQ